MSTGQADRVVQFVLQPTVASDAGQVFDRFAGMGIDANEQIARSAKTSAEKAAEAWESISPRTAPAATSPTRHNTPRGNSSEREAEKAAKAAEREAERREKAEIARELKIFHAKQKAIEDRQKAEERAARDAERESEKREKAEVAREQKIFRARQKAIEDRQKAEEKAARETERVHAKAISAVEQAQSRMTSGQAALAEGFKQTMGGATALARGLALVGAASEEDMEQAVRMLAKVEAGVQAVRGTVDLVQGITKAWRGYTATIEAAALAHEGLAAAQAISGMAGGVAGVGRGAAAGVGRSALRETGEIVVSGLAGATGAKLMGAGGTGTGAVGLGGVGLAAGGTVVAAELAALLALLTPWGQRKAQGMMTSAMYGQDDRGVAEGPGWFGRSAAYVSGVISTPQWIRSGETPWGSVSESKRVFDSADATRKQTKRKLSGRDFQQAQAERVTVEAELNDRQRNAEDDAVRRQRLADAGAGVQDQYRTAQVTAIEEAQRRRAAWEAQRPDMLASEEDKGKYAMAGSRLAMEEAQKQRELEAKAGVDTASAAHRIAQEEAEKARQEAETVRERLAQMTSTGMIDGHMATGKDRAKLDHDLEAAGKRDQAAQERLVQANQERLNQEERIKQVRIQAADESIAKTQEEISLRQQIIDREKQRLMSAQERIASMSEGEQQEYARILEKARNGETLTAEEFNKLGSVNTEETERLRRSQAERRSRQFMDQTGIGQEERERIDRMEREKKELEVTLKDERELRVAIERDDNETVRKLAAEIRRQLEERDRKMIDQVKLEIERGKQEVYNRMNQRLSQR